MMRNYSGLVIWTAVIVAQVGGIAFGTEQEGSPESGRPQSSMPNLVARSSVAWHTEYGPAMSQAEADGKMMLIYFYDLETSQNQKLLEEQSLADPQTIAVLKRDFVAVRVPLGYEVKVGGKVQPLMTFGAFSELHRRPGIAVIDFVNREEEYFGHVVSVLPLDNGKYYRFAPEYIRTLVELPHGTLTQRTMIFAVRIHPERPASTRGRPNQTLFAEARSHSFDQARRRLQGHHNWAARFPRISALLPRGLRAQEVVAESWPNESLVDAAVDCVASWRQSPGHWNAVRSQQPVFGYDMKRGDNGIWYATGLFGNAD